MKELSHLQERILDELYGNSNSKTDPDQELQRICAYFKQLGSYAEDEFIMHRFNKMVQNQLGLALLSCFSFYWLDRFKEEYPEELKCFLGEYPDTIEQDFISKCISDQTEIVENTFVYMVNVPNEAPINAMQYVEKDFLFEYKHSSLRKIDFLNDRLNEISVKVDKSTNSQIENPVSTLSPIAELENPDPMLFTSVEVYKKVREFTELYIVNWHADYSYLKRKLDIMGLLHNVTDTVFMEKMLKLKLITQEHCDIYEDKKQKLSSLPKSSKNKHRVANFNRIFDPID
jgi:hypothetical protein